MNTGERLTKEEFRAHLEKGYFGWCSREPQSLLSWLTSLEDWSKVSWNQEYAKREGGRT
jgi:hypothetical protein